MSMDILRATKLKHEPIHSTDPKYVLGGLNNVVSLKNANNTILRTCKDFSIKRFN